MGTRWGTPLFHAVHVLYCASDCYCLYRRTSARSTTSQLLRMRSSPTPKRPRCDHCPCLLVAVLHTHTTVCVAPEAAWLHHFACRLVFHSPSLHSHNMQLCVHAMCCHSVINICTLSTKLCCSCLSKHTTHLFQVLGNRLTPYQTDFSAAVRFNWNHTRRTSSSSWGRPSW